jgi:hypothetical protein
MPRKEMKKKKKEKEKEEDKWRDSEACKWLK